MRGSAISGKPFRRGSLDLDTKAPLKRIRSSVNLWFDKVFGDVHLSPCPLEQVLGDDRPPDRRGRGRNGSWRALVMYTCWWLGVIHSRAPLRVEHSLRKSLVKAKLELLEKKFDRLLDPLDKLNSKSGPSSCPIAVWRANNHCDRDLFDQRSSASRRSTRRRAACCWTATGA